MKTRKFIVHRGDMPGYMIKALVNDYARSVLDLVDSNKEPIEALLVEVEDHEITKFLEYSANRGNKTHIKMLGDYFAGVDLFTDTPEKTETSGIQKKTPKWVTDLDDNDVTPAKSTKKKKKRKSRRKK